MEKGNLLSKRLSGGWNLPVLCFAEFVKTWEVAGR